MKKVLLILLLFSNLYSQSDTIYNYKTDSLAVRAILDSNGLDSIAVDSVTNVYDNRIVGLYLNNRGLIVIPNDIKKLNMLYSLSMYMPSF